MALAESIFSKFTESGSAVAALVGTRIFPGIAPQDTEAPYVVWQLVTSTPDVTHGEASASGLHLVQFSGVAATYLAARDLAEAIVAAIDSVTLAGGEVCLSCREQDGFSEATDQFLRHVDAEFFVPAAG